MLMLVLGLLCGILLTFLWSKKLFGIGQYILLILGLVLLLFCVDNFIGFGTELEPAAQRFVLLAMGLPGAILVALAFFWPKIRGLFKHSQTQKTA